MSKTLGILGGLGPAASVYFYRLITEHTRAVKDQDHLNIVLFSGADIPDRSEFILGKSDRSPLPLMKEDIRKLVSVGAEVIAVPCNTAHYFYDELEASSPVPVINIIRETVALAKANGAKKVGVLATSGTIRAGAYQKICADVSLDCAAPSPENEAALMEIIYGSIKQALPPDTAAFLRIADSLRADGCDVILLGCTELSLIVETPDFAPFSFIDSQLVLAKAAILTCGAEPCGFSATYDQVKPIALSH